MYLVAMFSYSYANETVELFMQWDNIIGLCYYHTMELPARVVKEHNSYLLVKPEKTERMNYKRQKHTYCLGLRLSMDWFIHKSISFSYTCTLRLKWLNYPYAQHVISNFPYRWVKLIQVRIASIITDLVAVLESRHLILLGKDAQYSVALKVE